MDGTKVLASGKGTVTFDGVLYPFWRQDDGMLAGARFDKAINGDTDYKRGDLDDPPALTADDEDTAGSELRTGLTVAGETFPLSDLLGAGTSTQDGDNFVAEARTDVEKISAQVATLIDLFGDGDATDKATLKAQLGNKWDDAQAAIDDVFGADVVELERETDSDDAADAFDDVVQALSSLDAFQAATAKDGEGVFESAELSADAAADAFDATDSQATATLGMLGDTRFGAVVRKQRANARTKLGYDYSAAVSTNEAHGGNEADVLMVLNGAKTGAAGLVTGITATGTPASGKIISATVVANSDNSAPVFGATVAASAIEVAGFSDAKDNAAREAAVKKAVEMPGVINLTNADSAKVTKVSKVSEIGVVGDGTDGKPYQYNVEIVLTRGTDTISPATVRVGILHVTKADSSSGGTVSQGAGELGAFAYATINDTVRTHHIQTSGNAYYAGATRAVGGNATLYSGDFEMQVRFRSERVSGLVSNLRDSDGAPWQFKYGDVDSIILPEADLGPSANWNKTTGGMAQITFAPRAGSPQPQPILGKFQGTLLGTGTAAGEQAVGTWSVGADPGEGSEYLAGGFGAARVEDAPTTLPASDDGTMTETTVTPVSGQTLADGTLTLAGNKWATNKVTGAIGLQNADDKFEISLATMFGKQDANTWANGDNQVDLARAEIERLMSQLNAFIALDNDDATEADTLLANKNRAEIWASVNTTIERYLFNNKTPVLDETDSANANVTVANWGMTKNNGYPVSSGGNALDSEALAEIQDVLDALASQSALADAFEEDEIFDGLNLARTAGGNAKTGVNLGALEPTGDIWGRRESRVQWRLSSTEYTRFGVWRKQVNKHAVAEYETRSGDDADGPGRFAYSPLAQTSYASTLDPSYPAGGVADYTGETLAIQNGDFYSGTIAVRVEWAATSVGGDLAAVISDLENVGNGDPLLYAVAATDKRAIREIVFAARVDADLSFEDESVAAITYFGGATGLDTEMSTTASLQGKFVGQDIDGPLGVIGTWTLKGGNAGAPGQIGNIGNNSHMIHGAFGAEVGP